MVGWPKAVPEAPASSNAAVMRQIDGRIHPVSIILIRLRFSRLRLKTRERGLFASWWLDRHFHRGISSKNNRASSVQPVEQGQLRGNNTHAYRDGGLDKKHKITA
jgi:hypothetical protein